MLKLIVAMLALSLQDADAPLAPHGKWVVQAEENSCLLSRNFGPSGDVTFAVLPITGAEGVDLILVSPDPRKRDSVGQAILTSLPGEAKAKYAYDSALREEHGQRVTHIYLKRSDLEPLDGAQGIAIRSGDQPQVTVALQDFAKARVAMEKCETALLKRWGIDPAAIAKPAEFSVNPGSWITNDDYPAEALRERRSGMLRFRLMVGTDGRVGECAVTSSSGSPIIDQAVCKAISTRARFKPALNAQGEPIPGIFAARFRFGRS